MDPAVNDSTRYDGLSQASDATARQFTEVVALNSKLQYDSAAQLQNQSLIDNQSDSCAWAELKLTEARDSQRIKHLAEVNLLVASQTGETEDQQNVSPTDQATAEAIKGTVGVSADAIAASLGNLEPHLCQLSRPQWLKPSARL